MAGNKATTRVRRRRNQRLEEKTEGMRLDQLFKAIRGCCGVWARQEIMLPFGHDASSMTLSLMEWVYASDYHVQLEK